MTTPTESGLFERIKGHIAAKGSYADVGIHLMQIEKICKDFQSVFDFTAKTVEDQQKVNDQLEQRLADIIADRDSWRDQCSDRVKDWDATRVKLAEAEANTKSVAEAFQYERGRRIELERVVAEKDVIIDREIERGNRLNKELYEALGGPNQIDMMTAGQPAATCEHDWVRDAGWSCTKCLARQIEQYRDSGQPAAGEPCVRCNKPAAENTLNGVEHVCNDCLFGSQPAPAEDGAVAWMRHRLMNGDGGLGGGVVCEFSEHPFRDGENGDVEPLYAQPRAAVPAGWKLVPNGTNWDMRNDARELLIDNGISATNLDALVDTLYRAMLAASPTPGGVEGRS